MNLQKSSQSGNFIAGAGVASAVGSRVANALVPHKFIRRVGQQSRRLIYIGSPAVMSRRGARYQHQSNRNKMPLRPKKLAFVGTLVFCAQNVVCAQNTTSHLQRLVEISARRLVIAEQVALAKWDNGTPVEDPSREARILADAVSAGESKGLDPASVSNFFRAQIEANKLIQYSLLAEWRRTGKAPDHSPVNLVGTIRPELDQLQTELIAEMTETVVIRERVSCRTDIAQAVGKYVSAHKDSLTSLRAIALDRALAAACNDVKKLKEE